jgi:hypothetical protein
MKWGSVVVLSGNSSAVALVDDLLAEMTPDECALGVRCGKACTAALASPVRRRMLVVDGPPSDFGPGSLVEAVRIVDRTIPIVFIRSDWEGQPTVRDAVYIQPGPFVSAGTVLLLEHVFRTTALARSFST